MPAENQTDVNLEDFEKDDSKEDAQLQSAVEKEVHEREAITDVPVRITAVVGEKSMPVRELIKLGRGAVIPLGRKVGAPIDIYANDRMIASGEITIIEDDQIAVTMTEIITTSHHE